VAALTITDILARFRVVLEAEPLNLIESNDAFSHQRQPAGVVTNSYYIEDTGIVSNRSVGNYDTVRLQRLTVYVARVIPPGQGSATLATVETTLTAIERALIADGASQSYAIAMDVQRRVTKTEATDIAIGSLAVTVDHDYDES